MTSQRTIYTDLVNAGLSSNQAAGVMGNMEYESGFNVEAHAMDTNGFESNGLIQWNEASYPDSGSLITGNVNKDLQDQINYLIHNTHNTQEGLQGSTAGQVGGNWASHVEVCQGCQPGGAQYNERVAAATRIEQSAQSGNWPKGGSGISGSGGGGSNANTTANVSCGSFWQAMLGGPNSILQYLSCQSANGIVGGVTGSNNLGPIAGFFMDPVDAFERGGLVIFGAILVIVGIAILGFGPASQMLGAAAGTSRDVRAASALLGPNNPRRGAANDEERRERLDLAKRNAALGERKQQFREEREQRLATTARRPTRKPVSPAIKAKREGRANAKRIASSSSN